MHGAIFAGGGDDPANEFIIGSGPGALLCRYFSGRRHLAAEDPPTPEWAGTYRHYHSAMTPPLPLGRPPPLHRELPRLARTRPPAASDSLRPANPPHQAL